MVTKENPTGFPPNKKEPLATSTCFYPEIIFMNKTLPDPLQITFIFCLYKNKYTSKVERFFNNVQEAFIVSRQINLMTSWLTS